MTRLVVVSDSHGNPAALRRAIASVPDASAVFFLGDGIRDLLQVRGEFPGLRFYPVAGNCDFQRSYPTEGLVPFEGKLIFYTHGHLYGVALGPEQLQLTGENRGADIVLFGHTHRPLIVPGERDWPAALNPGSCSRPRGPEGPTFAVLTLEKDQPPHMEIRRLREGGSQ